MCLDLHKDIDVHTWINTKKAVHRMLGSLAPESLFSLLALSWLGQGLLLSPGRDGESALQLNFPQDYRLLESCNGAGTHTHPLGPQAQGYFFPTCKHIPILAT